MSRLFTRSGLLLLFSAVVAGSGGAPPLVALGQRADVIDIVVERFSFTPSEFRVKAGVPVDIRLHSEDTDHGFRILGTDVNVRIPKRGKGAITVTFQPPSAGRYVFECSNVCGAGHAFMRGTLIAE